MYGCVLWAVIVLMFLFLLLVLVLSFVLVLVVVWDVVDSGVLLFVSHVAMFVLTLRVVVSLAMLRRCVCARICIVAAVGPDDGDVVVAVAVRVGVVCGFCVVVVVVCGICVGVGGGSGCC